MQYHDMHKALSMVMMQLYPIKIWWTSMQ